MLNSTPKFGVAGFPPNFCKSPFKKKRENIFAWLHSLHLDWVELQNTYGIKMSDEQANDYKRLAREYNIGISIHAPYFITLASGDSEVVRRSQERIKQAFELSYKLDSKRIIFHPGHFPGKSDADRNDGLSRLIANLNEIKSDLPLDNNIFIYPEIAGKINQLGSFQEIIEICQKVDFARPCLDLAHLHARDGGTLESSESIYNIFDAVEIELGRDVLQDCHIHMYPVGIDHTGEKGHKAFNDIKKSDQLSLFDINTEGKYYPQAVPFIKAITEKNITPIVVCEAKDTQDEGALLMKDLYSSEGSTRRNCAEA